MNTSRPLLSNLLIITSSLTVIFGLPLFLAAGSLSFWNGWIFLAVFVICSTIISAINPELTTKRATGAEKEIPQEIIKLLLTLCACAIPLVSGLDYRNNWSSVPTTVVAVFSLIMIGAFVLLSIVLKENRFALRVVEIQKDQKIIDTGTYSVVRHPMYLAFTVIFSVSPLVLGSLYSLIPAICIPFLLAFRIRKEEEVLRNGLVGYDHYIKKVRYRLIPFVW